MLKPPCHQIYLLRCWEERSLQGHMPSTWRYSLEDPQTGERHGFADIGTLLRHLHATLLLLSHEPGTRHHSLE